MRQWLKALFSEHGSVSATRVMSMITCITACYLALKDPTAVGMVGTLLATGLGAKVGQKFAETKQDDKPSQ